MKQLIYMVLLTGLGTVGALINGPFWAVFVYYHFAVLRPQFLWKWSLPPDVAWSFYVAIVAVILTPIYQGAGSSSGQSGVSNRRWSSTHVWMFLYACWIILTYFTARVQDVAYPWLIENLKIFVMFFVASLVVKSVRAVWLLFVMTAFTLGYIAYEINFDYFVNHYMGIGLNGYGGYDNNGAGLMLAMGVPLCLFVWDGTYKWYRWLAAAMVPILMHAVMMTFSRGAMVSLLAASPFCWLFSRHRKQLAVTGILTILTLIPAMAGPEIRARFFSIGEHEVDESANSRKTSWAAAWRMALDNPITGVGIRNSNLFSHFYGGNQGQTTHNQYLQIAADSGLVALGLYLALLLTVGVGLRRTRKLFQGREDEEGQQAQAIVSGIMCSGIVYCIGAVFLSLESFELTYLLTLLGTQMVVIAQQPLIRSISFLQEEPNSVGWKTI